MSNQELESFLNSGVNMDYMCPFCNNKRVGFHNRTPENEPIQLTRNIRKQTSALKMFIHNTNDLELYLDCIKYLYDIKAKQYRELESEVDSSDVEEEEEEQLNIDLSELSEEIISLIHAIGHAEGQKYNWMNEQRIMLTERRQNGFFNELNNYEFIEIGRRANTSLYRYDDALDNLTVLVPIGNTVSPVQSAATISPADSPSIASDSWPETPPWQEPTSPATIPPLTLPRSASPQSTNNDFEINFLSSDNNNGDSKEDPEDVDMRRRRRGTRHGTNVRAARTNGGGKRKRRRKTKKKAQRRRTKKRKSLFKKKRTKGKNKKRKKKRGYGGKIPQEKK